MFACYLTAQLAISHKTADHCEQCWILGVISQQRSVIPHLDVRLSTKGFRLKLKHLAVLTFLCLSLVELMSSCRNCDWIWYSRFLSRAPSASCKQTEDNIFQNWVYASLCNCTYVHITQLLFLHLCTFCISLYVYILTSTLMGQKTHDWIHIYETKFLPVQYLV